MLAETSHQTIPQPFAELVHRQTEGNPLFVHETLRYVIDAGLMEPRDGALRRVGDQGLAGRIPEGLRDAVGKRLSRLSDSTNRVLSVASVIGREFQLDVLREVLVIPDEELEAALEEASAASIIEERSVVGTTIMYRFGHAFFLQTLYDEIVAPRRIRLHQRVAHALEEVHRARMEEHAAELAEHYAFSSDLWTWRRRSTTENWPPDAPRTCLPTVKQHVNWSGRSLFWISQIRKTRQNALISCWRSVRQCGLRVRPNA